MNGAQKVDKRKVEINKFSLIFNKLGIYVVVLLLNVAGVILSGGQFFTASNIQSILEAKVQEFGNPSTSKLNKVGTGTLLKVQDP